MTISTVFINNRTQAVRLPVDLRLPEHYPQIDDAKLTQLRKAYHEQGYAELAFQILSLYIDDIPAADLNADPAVHGILVQLPLPKHLDETQVLETIDVTKDVDGFHAENVGRLSQGLEAFIPCTPHGVMKMLESAEVPVQGAEAVIIGRSNIVGKPMAMLLTNAGATVTVCHSKTRDLASHTRRADILVAAIGKPRFVTADMVKPGATVIDVGINRLQDGPDAGKLCGDVDFEAVKAVAAAITPVPGGVGPMTITMLLENTVISAARVARAARK